MLRREPAVVIAALAAVVQGVLIFWTSDPSYDASEILTPILTLLVGGLVRSRVTPVEPAYDGGYRRVRE